MSVSLHASLTHTITKIYRLGYFSLTMSNPVRKQGMYDTVYLDDSYSILTNVVSPHEDGDHQRLRKYIFVIR